MCSKTNFAVLVLVALVKSGSRFRPSMPAVDMTHMIFFFLFFPRPPHFLKVGIHKTHTHSETERPVHLYRCTPLYSTIDVRLPLPQTVVPWRGQHATRYPTLPLHPAPFRRSTCTTRVVVGATLATATTERVPSYPPHHQSIHPVSRGSL